MAVDGISLSVQAGEILGIVGPNGAGKTTTVECLRGAAPPGRGARCGCSASTPGAGAPSCASASASSSSRQPLPDRLKVWEALDLYAAFYRHPADWRQLLEEWGLAAKRDAAFADLSGGQRQRLFIALALVGRPEVVFLDELTTGLDPQARRATWELVRQVRAEGATVVLVSTSWRRPGFSATGSPSSTAVGSPSTPPWRAGPWPPRRAAAAVPPARALRPGRPASAWRPARRP